MKRDELIEVLGTYDPPAGHRIDTIVVVTDHWIMVTTSADGEHPQHDSITQDPVSPAAWAVKRAVV